ncbi:MAG: bifunctional hydroxymethylpyrimidine kinase/phosphomethylpyrimidine kinase, partial [Algiphilus sp.]
RPGHGIAHTAPRRGSGVGWPSLACRDTESSPRLLSGAQRLSDAAVALGARGAAHVLVTGGDEAGTEPRTDWHWHDGAVRALSRSRWAQSYHGAGCTLDASIAALLARGLSPTTAIDQASAQVHAWLGTPKVIGGGRPSPLRQGPVAP